MKSGLTRAPGATSLFFVFIGLFSNFVVQSSTGNSQTLAAGKAQTNLATESLWPGAQNPPYICCWDSQGQYVTFSFSIGSSGPTTFALRYSAGDGAITRKIEVDGTTWTGRPGSRNKPSPVPPIGAPGRR
jgi:hypothetical protein